MGLEDCSADLVVAKDRYPAELARARLTTNSGSPRVIAATNSGPFFRQRSRRMENMGYQEPARSRTAVHQTAVHDFEAAHVVLDGKLRGPLPRPFGQSPGQQGCARTCAMASTSPLRPAAR